MGIFDNALSRLIDNGERLRQSIIEEAQRAWDEFDFDATVNAIAKKGSELYGGFNNFMKNVKDTVSDFKVIVPFDERYEKFKYDVTGETLNVRVDSKNGFRETSASIPENCKVDEIRHIINSKRKELVVIIPKTIKGDKNIKDAKEAVVNSLNGTADWLKKCLSEKKEEAEHVAKTTRAPKSKRAQRPATPVKKVVRDAKGRFVSSK